MQVLLSYDLANEQGYEQIIWTDDATHSYFEESGTMNVLYVWEILSTHHQHLREF